MQITYVVLAHHKPAQFRRLVTRLTRDGDRVVAHVDQKADQATFHAPLQALGDHVSFTAERFDVRWGGFESVDAELAALRHAVRVAPGDYYILLSGVDYPIRQRAELVTELASGAVYMESWLMPDEKHNKPMSRLDRFYFPARNRGSLAFRALNKAALVAPPQRSVSRGLGGRQPYGGSQWWAMPHDCAERVLAFVESEPRFVAFFRRSRNPDEMFFQTVVQNLPGYRWPIRPPLTFANWAPERLEAARTAPATLTVDDIPELRRRHAFFARKFDLDRDPRVLDMIDEQLLETASER